jgi:D-alanyl-D-alanine carboxypeptidase
MTGYVVDRAIDSHRITFDDIVTVGKTPGRRATRSSTGLR